MLFKQHREIKKVADGTLLEFNEVKYSSPDGALLNTANLSAPVDLNTTSRIHYGAQILRDCKAVGGQIETCSFKGKPLSCCHISYTSPQGEMILDSWFADVPFGILREQSRATVPVGADCYYTFSQLDDAAW